jgi:hypothetical protein
MTSHPNAIDLEAFACGEPIARVAEHVESCDACRGYLAKVGGLEAPALPAPRAASIRPKRVRVELLAIPLAIAAAVLFFVRSPASQRLDQAHLTIPPVTVPEPTQVAVVTHEDPPGVRFKGGLQLAVVRERGAHQDRFTDGFTIRPGDRLRLEVAVDESRAILGAVLGDDGSWLEMMEEGVRDAGTYFSEKSARIDSEPTAGTLIVGDPGLVRAAKLTHRFEGLRTVRVEVEGGNK